MAAPTLPDVTGPRIYRPQARAILQVIFDGYADDVRDSEIQVIPVIPKSVTVHINSYKQADSFELVFEAIDLPIDPRLVRAGAAEIFLFNGSGEADQRVMSRRQPLTDPDPGGVRPRDATGTIALELGTDTSADVFTLGHKPRIVGLFDDDDMELSESGKWVTIRGQDYTAYLAATQFPPLPNGTARRIPIGKRLDQIVEDLLEEADPDGVLSVDVRGIDPATLPIVHAGMESATNKRGIPVETATSYWDVMYKLVERYGFICFVDNFDVVISRPKTITDKDTPQIKRMAWGKNLEHLQLKRHLGKEQAPTIVARSYVPGVGTISAEFPTGQIERSGIFKFSKKGKARFKRRVKESTTVSKKGKVRTTVRERDEYQIVVVHGITDPKVLAQIAENRYHLLGKSERTITAKTRDLTDLRNVDILGVTAGDAFSIDWDEFNVEMLSNPALSTSAKIAHLEARGFQAGVAAEIANRYQILRGLDRPLRFKEGTVEYDVDDGVSIEMVLQDFMVVDGIRAGSGAPRQSSLDRAAQATKRDGQPIGWSPAKQAAQIRRFDKNR